MKITKTEILNSYKGDKRSKEYKELKKAVLDDKFTYKQLVKYDYLKDLLEQKYNFKEWEEEQTGEEYESYKENHAALSTGLGDKIEKVTKATGIKKAVDAVFDALGKDCGCEDRKKKLNQMFPSRKPECFTEEEFNLMKFAIDTKKNKFSAEEVKTYAAIYERIFRTKVECTQCSFRNTVWNALVRIYNEYK